MDWYGFDHVRESTYQLHLRYFISNFSGMINLFASLESLLLALFSDSNEKVQATCFIYSHVNASK